jgi:hypothetical protein
MLTITPVSHPSEWAVLRKVPGGYLKRKAFLSEVDHVALTGRYWDGGSRDSYLHLKADGTVQRIPQCAPAVFGGPAETQVLHLAPGECVIRYGICMGKTATAHIFRKGKQT